MDNRKRSMIIVLIIWSLLTAVLCTAPTVTAFAAPKQVITDIYHIHLGNALDGGGCYGKECYHKCQGNADSGGACYETIPHTHGASCYREEECILYNTGGAVIGHKTAFCPAHGTREFDIAEGVSRHTSCGMGEVASTFVYCPDCGVGSPEIHEYHVVVCGLEEGKYSRICGKDDGETQEGYELDCGLEGICGHLIVTNETAETGDKVTLHVQTQDLTGGKLLLSEEPYTWYDKDGNVLGSGEYLEVEANGDYQVEVHLENRDVDESGLRGFISVDNIGQGAEASPGSDTGSLTEPTPQPEAETSPDVGPLAEAEEEPTAEPIREEDAQEDDPGDLSNVPTALPTASLTVQQEERLTEAGERRERAERFREDQAGQSGGKGSVAKETALPTALPTAGRQEMLTKREQTVAIPEAMEDIVIEVQPVVRKQSFWERVWEERPVVRLVTVTLGALLLFAGVFLLLFYLRKSVRLYNDNGEGRWNYLGRLPVRTEEEGYVVIIPEKLAEKAYTNRYLIRPGLFLPGRSEEELLVYGETKRIAVLLSREMVVML